MVQFSDDGGEIFVNDDIAEDSEDRIKSFERIYKDGSWKTRSKESSSGFGSTKKNTVRMIHILNKVVDHLKKVMNKEKIKILDSSCGDMNWMPTFLHNRSDVIFTGYDITGTGTGNLQ